MRYIIIGLLATVILTQTVLVWSDPSTTKIISPADKKAAIEKIYAGFRPAFIGAEAQWLGIEGMDNGMPNNYQVTYQALFYADCPHQPANLVISGDDVFIAYLNGQSVGSRSNWQNSYSLPVALSCGLNNLTITLINYHQNTPGALIFKVIQDQTNCYKCNPIAFYNFDTCGCQCDTKENSCNNALKQWMNYPACGCKCTNQLFSNCNLKYQHFNEAICACQCRTVLCPNGFQQDPASCQCKCKSAGCATGQRWNYKKCACEAIPCVKTTCTGLRVWNDSSCSCICPSNVACPSSQTFDAASCSCK